MLIQTFKNGKGLIWGGDSKRIDCDRNGVLKFSDTEIPVIHGGESIMPLLFHGATGDYQATFTDEKGDVYDLGKVRVRSGRIAPPPPVTVELMELRSRADVLESENESLQEKVEELSNIFDTNSLNFLIG